MNTLSQAGIFALEIIIKEFMNVHYHSYISNIEQLLLDEIHNYFTGKESDSLSYISKKALDIIKLDYMNYYELLSAIKNYLNKDIITPINNKRRVNTTDDKICKKNKNLDIQ